MKEKVYSQKEIMDVLIPELKSDGIVYKKTKEVFARKSIKGEAISTITSDGLETVNIAREGDYIIKNQTEAEEEYIIGGDKFAERYEFLEDTESDFSQYGAKGKIIGLEMNKAFLEKMNFPEVFFFYALWGEKSIVKKGDFLVCLPDYSEVYRITRKEFFETYDLDD